MLSLFFAALFAAMPACPVEDATNCAWDGGDNSFVAIHAPGTPNDTLIFRDHIESVPSNY